MAAVSERVSATLKRREKADFGPLEGVTWKTSLGWSSSSAVEVREDEEGGGDWSMAGSMVVGFSAGLEAEAGMGEGGEEASTGLGAEEMVGGGGVTGEGGTRGVEVSMGREVTGGGVCIISLSV